MSIITKKLVLRALDLVTPTVELILSTEGMTWGPRWVKGLISAPGMNGKLPFTLGQETEWNAEWGEKRDFSDIAAKKLQLAEEFGGNTSTIVAICPWEIRKGLYLYPGGSSHLGISVGVSGAKGRVDETIANLIIDCIIMLAHLETDTRAIEHKMQI